MGQNNVENVSGGKWLTIRLVQRLSAESGTKDNSTVCFDSLKYRVNKGDDFCLLFWP